VAWRRMVLKKKPAVRCVDGSQSISGLPSASQSCSVARKGMMRSNRPLIIRTFLG